MLTETKNLHLRRLAAAVAREQLEEMIVVESFHPGVFQVNLKTEGMCHTMTKYETSAPTERSNAAGAAASARRYFIDQIANRIAGITGEESRSKG